MADDGSSKVGRSRRADPRQEHALGDLHYYVPREILDVSFPVAVRGYDRAAVDAYIKRVNRVIAELKVSASPPAAVRHALEQAEEKVQSLLRAAREAAEELTASAGREAEEDLARAKAEAAELVVSTSAEAERAKGEADEVLAKARREADAMRADANAEAQSTIARAEAEAADRLRRLQEELAARRDEADTRMRELQADTEAVWKERGELLDDIGEMASTLADLASSAVARLQRPELLGPEEEVLEPAAPDERDTQDVATDQSTTASPAVASRQGANDESQKKAKTASVPHR